MPGFTDWVLSGSEDNVKTDDEIGQLEKKLERKILKDNPKLAKQSYSNSAVNKMLSKDFKKHFGKKK